MSTEQEPTRVAMLAFTPDRQPDRHMVVRAYNHQPEPYQLALADHADAEGDHAEADRIREMLRAEAHAKTTMFTLEQDHDRTLSTLHANTMVFTDEEEYRVRLRHVPAPLVHLMADATQGALHVWAPPAPGRGAYSVLLPRVLVHHWYATYRWDMTQMDVELVAARGRTQHPPYGPLPDSAADLACKCLTYEADALPQPTEP